MAVVLLHLGGVESTVVDDVAMGTSVEGDLTGESVNILLQEKNTKHKLLYSLLNFRLSNKW